MKASILVALTALALSACGNETNDQPTNTVETNVTEGNVVGVDRCGEPIREGQPPLNRDDGTPCK